MDLLSGVSFQRLHGALQAASLRHQVLANNIANVDVPEFKRSDVVFEELLAQSMGAGSGGRLALKTTDPRHISSGGSFGVPAPKIVTEESTAIGNNRNNVDIDKEMSMLAENQLRYNLFVQQLNHQIKLLRTGIMGR